MMMMLVMVIIMQLRDPVLGGQELTPKSADSQTKRTVPFSLAVQLGRDGAGRDGTGRSRRRRSRRKCGRD